MAGTVIGPGITIDGEVTGSEPLVIQGTLKGTVKIENTLHVEPEGQVEAEIEAETVVVAGTVSGEVTANQRIEIKEGGSVLGNVRSPRILIADGAIFRGSIDMDV